MKLASVMNLFLHPEDARATRSSVIRRVHGRSIAAEGEKGFRSSHEVGLVMCHLDSGLEFTIEAKFGMDQNLYQNSQHELSEVALHAANLFHRVSISDITGGAFDYGSGECGALAAYIVLDRREKRFPMSSRSGTFSFAVMTDMSQMQMLTGRSGTGVIYSTHEYGSDLLVEEDVLLLPTDEPAMSLGGDLSMSLLRLVNTLWEPKSDRVE